MNRIIRYSIAAVLAALLTLASGCSSSRRTASPGQATPLPPATSTAGQLILGQLHTDAGPWTDFYAPFTLKLRRPISLSVSGRATMVRGQSILFSARMLGIEIAQLYVDADSAWLVDKFHKLMCAVPTDRLTGVSGLTVGNLQDLLLGRPFYPGTADLTSALANLAVTEADEAVVLRPRKADGAADWSMTLVSGPVLAAVDLALSGGKRLGLQFSQPVTSAQGPVPSEIDATGQAGKFVLDASLGWSLGKARWNRGDIKAWTPPAGYRRITPAQLIETLKSM